MRMTARITMVMMIMMMMVYMAEKKAEVRGRGTEKERELRVVEGHQRMHGTGYAQRLRRQRGSLLTECRGRKRGGTLLLLSIVVLFLLSIVL